MRTGRALLRRANLGGLDRTIRSAIHSGALQSAGRVCDLSATRGVLRLSGAELIPFLQGLLTNDIARLQNQSSPPVYATLLNAKGRHLHDLFLNRADGSEAVIMADVDSSALPDLRRKLLMYKLRSAVDIADVSDEFSVWTRFGQDDSHQGDWQEDPRLKALGHRTILPKGESPDSAAGPAASPDEFAEYRCHLGVAEGDQEMPSGDAMPLEYNLDALHGVSYTKGCYVGQELIARTHNRGVVRKRLMPISFEGAAPEVGASIEPAQSGQEAGKIRAVSGDVGLAHMRLKQGLQAVSGELELQSGGTKIRVLRPEWWPQEWGHEEE